MGIHKLPLDGDLLQGSSSTATDLMTPVSFDPGDAAFPHKATSLFAALRTNCPVLRHGSDRWPFFSVFTYHDVANALSDWKTWSSEIPAIRDLVLGDAAVMIHDAPPNHEKYRCLLHSLTKGHTMREDIRRVVDAALSAHMNRDVEFVEGVAGRISLSVICQIIGIPESDAGYLRDWTNRLSAAVGCEFIETAQDALDSQQSRVTDLHEELTLYLRCLTLDAKRCLSSGLVKESLTWPVSESERLGLLKSIAFAGNHTSTILQTNAIWLLATHGPQFGRLKRHEVGAVCAAKEVLRYKSPFRGVTRIAKHCGEIRGVPYYRGDYLLAWIASANRDNMEFTDPDE